MDELSQARFDDIVSREPEDLNEDERSFLFARRPYLSKEQKQQFDEVLVAEQKKSEDKLAREAKGQDVKEGKDQANGEFAEVKKEAKELGIDTNGKSIDELRVAISTIKGPQAN